MCLIALAWRGSPDYRLVVVANRDEFHMRATAPVSFWEDAPQLLAGRDLEAGGTWLGVTRQGRFAAITNVREPGVEAPSGAPSRGALVRDFLLGEASHAFLDLFADLCRDLPSVDERSRHGRSRVRILVGWTGDATRRRSVGASGSNALGGAPVQYNRCGTTMNRVPEGLVSARNRRCASP